MRLLLSLLVSLIFIAACSPTDGAIQPTPTTEFVWQATPALVDPIIAASSTATLAPTSTPESPIITDISTPLPPSTSIPIPSTTARLSFTPTLLPTATPVGFFQHAAGGFSLSYPAGWELVEQNADGLAIIHDEWGLTLQAHAAYGAAQSLEDALAGYTDPAKGIFLTSELRSVETLTLADGRAGQLAFAAGHNLLGHGLGLLLLHVEAAPRRYDFVAFGPRSKIEENLSGLKALLQTLQLQPGQLYGVDREQAWVYLSGPFRVEDFDPATALNTEIVGKLYAGLVQLNANGDGVLPDLAESWQISADGTVYTFTLRSGQTFLSGTPLTAADVIYSWERAGGPRVLENIAELRIASAEMLVVRLGGPRPAFLFQLTLPAARILSRAAVEAGADWRLRPDSSGAYALRQWLPGEALILERNESYQQTNQPTARPTTQQTTQKPFLIYRQLPGSPLDWLQAGEVDVAHLSWIEGQIVSNPAHPLHDRLTSQRSRCTLMLLFDTARPPFDDLAARRAFTLATDGYWLAELLTGSASLRATALLPPDVPGFSSHQPQAYDPAGAVQLLNGSKYSGGLPAVILAAPGYPELGAPYAEALAQMWRDTLHAQVAIQYLDPTQFENEARRVQAQAVIYGWCADAADAQLFLEPLFSSLSPFNLTGYANPQVDALLAAARGETDPAQRVLLYHKINLILLLNVAALPLANSVDWIVGPP